MFKTYYNLTKPGIIYGNLVNTLSGFFLACVLQQTISLQRMTAVVLGTALVIACGCVVNNYIDRGIDKHMKRTKNRALVLGKVSTRSALVFATVLGLAGFAVLWLWTNTATLLIGAIGIIDYVIAYGYFKRHSPIGTIVGSISGATPPLAGYVAVTGGLDETAIVVFLLFAAWQMPHFYAIALYRSEEYRAAGIPVLPVKKGRTYTQYASLAYIALFAVCCVALSVIGSTGYTFAAAMGLLSLAWLYKGINGLAITDRAASDASARSMFGFSLIVTIALVVMLPLGALLP